MRIYEWPFKDDPVINAVVHILLIAAVIAAFSWFFR